ncbi:MAG: glycyl-radical enzyme activating protein [Dehalococcoidia bacterium]
MPTGITFNVQRFSTEDGPGIRTTVFMKGCPLRCKWCHNPEGLSPQPELVWYDVRCIGARECLAVCPEDALELMPDGMCIDRQRCTVCGKCQEACPAGALEVIGREWTAEALYAEVAKDKVFYQTSGGGVTVSGGEPMMQAEFVEAFLRLCHQGGMHTALDTCGHADWLTYERVLPFVDLVLYDLKLMDPERHRQATGIYPDRILENARRIAQKGTPTWVRTPVIPDYTDDEDNIARLAAFIRHELTTVERWDLLAYTNLGQPKYRRLGRPYPLDGTELPTRAKMEALHTLARSRGVEVAAWSGAVRD